MSRRFLLLALALAKGNPFYDRSGFTPPLLLAILKTAFIGVEYAGSAGTCPSSRWLSSPVYRCCLLIVRAHDQMPIGLTLDAKEDKRIAW